MLATRVHVCGAWDGAWGSTNTLFGICEGGGVYRTNKQANKVAKRNATRSNLLHGENTLFGICWEGGGGVLNEQTNKQNDKK